MRFDVPVPLSTAPRLWPTRANNDALGNRTEAAKVPAAPAQGAHSGCERLRLGAFLEGNKFLHASNSRGTCNTVAWKHPPLLHVASCLYLLAHPVLSSCFMHFFSSFFFHRAAETFFLPAHQEDMTPLHWACFHNHAKHAQMLLAANANVAAVDIEGKNALHWTSGNKDASAAKVCCALPALSESKPKHEPTRRCMRSCLCSSRAPLLAHSVHIYTLEYHAHAHAHTHTHTRAHTHTHTHTHTHAHMHVRLFGVGCFD